MIFHQQHNRQANQISSMTMSKTMTSSPPQHQNGRLELLSNTALLKKVMDSRVTDWKQKQQQLQGSGSPVGDEASKPTMSSPPPALTSPTTNASAVASPNGNTTILKTQEVTMEKEENPSTNLPAEKSSSAPTSPTLPSATASPGEQPRMIYVPSPASYASLLLPTATAQGVAALSPQQLQSLQALAAQHHQLPQNVKAAMALMGTTPKVYGGPHSAFQKPYLQVLKENVPPSFGSSPILSRQTSPSIQSPGEASAREGPSSPSYEALLQENRRLQQEMKKKDETIASLQNKADGLEKQICELRQLPTGKISHIPIEDMIRIMQEYGSEVSNQTLPKRKQPIQKASIVRQFRRWNPEFFRFFVHVNGEWVPRLGKEGELKRRAEKRRSIQNNKRTGSPDSTKS